MTSLIFNTFIQHLRAFRADEDGAATVDFVILTSSVVMLGLAHVKDVADGATNFADGIDACLGTDLTAMLDADPENYIQNLEAAATACSSR